MSNPTIPLLAAFTEALTKLKVSTDDQRLPLMYAKIFLQRAIEENGRRSLPELQGDALKVIADSYERHREMFHALLLNQRLVNPDMNIHIADD